MYKNYPGSNTIPAMEAAPLLQETSKGVWFTGIYREHAHVSSSQVAWPPGAHGPSPDAEATTLWRVGEKTTIPWPEEEVARYHLM